MFYVFRLPSLFSALQKSVSTSRLHSAFVSSWKKVAPIRALSLGFITGLMAIALWLGAAVPAPVAQAAATPEAEAYDAGPIRQTRNPISGENFNGGVDASVVQQREDRRQPADDEKGFFGKLKDQVTGNDTQETTADLKTEKNPTLDRYPKSLD